MRTDPLMKLTYQQGRDGLLYPELQISENEKTDRTPVGKFGRLWKEYMMENHPTACPSWWHRAKSTR